MIHTVSSQFLFQILIILPIKKQQIYFYSQDTLILSQKSK